MQKVNVEYRFDSRGIHHFEGKEGTQWYLGDLSESEREEIKDKIIGYFKKFIEENYNNQIINYMNPIENEEPITLYIFDEISNLFDGKIKDIKYEGANYCYFSMQLTVRKRSTYDILIEYYAYPEKKAVKHGIGRNKSDLKKSL